MKKTPVKKSTNAAPLKSAKQLKKVAPLVTIPVIGGKGQH
jgi:hypothetical protein